jgi:16S rRNA processing protein RimM
VPFVAALVPEVDLDAGRLTVVDVAGLLDDREEADED